MLITLTNWVGEKVAVRAGRIAFVTVHFSSGPVQRRQSAVYFSGFDDDYLHVVEEPEEIIAMWRDALETERKAP